jgi:Protein of unknown function (DUF3352)
LAALSATAVLAAGCGGGGAGGEGDPASAVPPDALLYAELVVRPDGSLRDDANDAAGKVLRTDDPGGEIRRLVERLFEGEDFDYDRDVEPWLGERAGFWLRPTEGEDEFGALLLAATDTDAARESLEATLKRSGETITERSHRGSDYLVTDDGDAAGIVGDFVAIGPEAAYKRTVDASEQDSLAEADEYADAVDALEDDRLAHFWVDTAAFIELGARQDPDAAAQLDQLSAIVSLDDLPPIAGSFAADGDGLGVEVKVRGSGGALLGAGSTPLLQELPGDTWAALGAADVGESLRDTVDDFAGALGGIAVRREVRNQTGLDLDRDLLDWVGHTGVFVRGTTPATLDGGVVIQPTDEDRAADAFGRIVGAVQVKTKARAQPVDIAGADQAFALNDGRSPRPIVIARGSGLVVITAGRPAAEAALGSDDRLGDTDLYSEAEELVGMEPSALVGMPQLLELVNASGPDPGFAEAEPYLEAYSVLAAGVVDDGGLVVRLAAGLK